MLNISIFIIRCRILRTLNTHKVSTEEGWRPAHGLMTMMKGITTAKMTSLPGLNPRNFATANQARSNFAAVTATMVVLRHRQTEPEAYGEYAKTCKP
jgi:hypothetical protein